MPETSERKNYIDLDVKTKGERFRVAYEKFAELSLISESFTTIAEWD